MEQAKNTAPARAELSLAQVLGALSHALDLTEGQPPGHCLRSCWIGMWLGRELGLGDDELYDLYYTLLLKDSGCSSNAARLCELYGSDDRAAKHDVKTVDVQKLGPLGRFVLGHAGLGTGLVERFTRILHLIRHGDRLADELVSARCTRGAEIARDLGFSARVSAGIHGLDEHWNGKGRPEGLAGAKIPRASQIALLAQVVDVFHAGSGTLAARKEVRSRRGTWFDPALVAAFERVARAAALWEGLRANDLELRVRAFEPPSCAVPLTDERLDRIAAAFGQVIDAKSPFTAGHSARVGEISVAIGRELGFDPERLRWLRRTALLHDVGKLGVSNTILDKPGKLEAHEWEVMRRHPAWTEEILMRIDPFREMAALAAAHHERPDGKGYPRGLKGAEIALDARVVTTADIYDALTADRPYRAAMPREQALSILEEMRGAQLDPTCLDALLRVLARDSAQGEAA